MGKGAAGGKTSAPAVEDVLHRQQSFQCSGMLTGNGQAAGDCPPFCLFPPCEMWPASMSSCMHPTASQYLLGALPLRVARPWLLTNEALGGGATAHRRVGVISARRLFTGGNLSPVYARVSKRFVELKHEKARD